MSRFSGKQFKGAQWFKRQERRAEAEARNLKTKPERRRARRRLAHEEVTK